MTKPFWIIVGIAVLIWSAIELLSGTTWLHREVRRRQEPALYWVLQTCWLVLGTSCLLPLWL